VTISRSFMYHAFDSVENAYILGKEVITVHLICRHPVQADAVQSYCGQTIAAMTIHGDMIVGTLQSVGDGQIVLTPVSAPAAQVQSLKKQMAQKQGKRKGKNVVLQDKADVSFFGAGFGGFGAGLGGFGAGLGFTIPLFLLAALFADPFFF
jgi:hypothetical protein